jgi:hypothetical protein
VGAIKILFSEQVVIGVRAYLQEDGINKTYTRELRIAISPLLTSNPLFAKKFCDAFTGNRFPDTLLPEPPPPCHAFCPIYIGVV